MNEFVMGQLYIFIMAIVFGLVMGLVYDVLRLIRRLIPHNRVAIGAEDLIYWLVASIIIFCYVFKTNNGMIRGFIFIGISVGVLLYLSILSELFLRSMSKLIDTIVQIISKIVGILIKPLLFLFKPIFIFSKFILKTLKKFAKCIIIKMRTFIKEIKFIMNKV